MGDTSSAKRVSLTERTTAANPTQPKRSLAIPREPRWRALALSRWRRHCRLLSSSIHRPFRLFSAMFSFFLSFLSPVVVDQACYVHVVPRAPRWTREMGTHAARQPARQQHQPLRIKHEPVSPNGLSSQEETEWMGEDDDCARGDPEKEGARLAGGTDFPRFHPWFFARSHFGK